MAWNSLTKSYYKYVSDDGITYRVRVADYIATQLDGASNSIIGAVAAAGTEPKFAGSRRLRRAILRDLTNKKDHIVPVLTPDAPLITVPTPAGAGTLTLNYQASDVTCTYQGLFLTEQRGRRN
jgi:hypothetical protein